MSERTRAFAIWAPRVLGIFVTLFIGMFALDAFEEGRTVWRSIPGFLVHLIPALLMLATILIAWRRPAIGALVFLGLALLYTLSTLRRPDWILIVAGPLALVGVLYLVSWRSSRGAAGT